MDFNSFFCVIITSKDEGEIPEFVLGKFVTSYERRDGIISVPDATI